MTHPGSFTIAKRVLSSNIPREVGQSAHFPSPSWALSKQPNLNFAQRKKEGEEKKPKDIRFRLLLLLPLQSFHLWRPHNFLDPPPLSSLIYSIDSTQPPIVHLLFVPQCGRHLWNETHLRGKLNVKLCYSRTLPFIGLARMHSCLTFDPSPIHSSKAREGNREVGDIQFTWNTRKGGHGRSWSW